ncbi:hypothetical protein CBP36_19835 (plasmid) [Acidovorax carolinensis]|uniref:Conjugal transfer protein TrbI n=1 Tax=Acidovorax carolinensis TaxID=553814 RepID=A0A240UJL7_9BURK|nr:DotG/IcmE/VirB10 family protein [Acidovorax carolinensis]ART57160.1 hypothetical protein CBP35_19800 [Acidovorax carolinensis]ART61219.1 hypothetical protein CBP36_19835 [Acidovorax carolinensis]
MNNNTENDADLYGDEDVGANEVGNGPKNPSPNTKLENISALTQNTSTKKVIVITIGAVFLIAGLILIMMRSSNKPQSLPKDIQGVSVGNTPTLQPAKNDALANSDQYRQMVDNVNSERSEKALRDGLSVQPMAAATEQSLRDVPGIREGQGVGPTPGMIPPPQIQAPVNNQVQGPAQQSPEQQAQTARAQEAILSLMAERPRGTQTFQLASTALAAGLGAGEKGGTSELNKPASSDPAAAEAKRMTLIAAGTMESVRMDTSINTDLPGSFSGTILTGKYAGSKVVGSASRKAYLAAIEFKSISIPNSGITLKINAIGIDAATNEAGTATDVDKKLITKYGLKPLAAGLAAIGEAIQGSGTTVVVNGGSTVQQTEEITGKKATKIAVGAAAKQLTTDADGMDTVPTVRVEKGTIIGILFTEDVIYKTDQ